MKNIVVIGGGNMGFTYAEGVFNAQIANIQIVEKFDERVLEINAMNKMTATSSYDVIKEADVVFLAVKPQVALDVFEEIKTFINQNQVFVSVMAGMKMATIQEGLGVKKIVRCMPNLPASIQLGMTTYIRSEEVSDEELDLAARILKSTGKAFELEEEVEIDYTTGISGSGSAYVFYFMNAMAEAAEKLGFNAEQSKELVSQTFEGAVELYKQNDISLTEWMNRVASKGGTTREALNTFDDKKVNEGIKEGIDSCVKRAFELGGK
jgi:pyrroline-5-carboxylate reductase